MLIFLLDPPTDDMFMREEIIFIRSVEDYLEYTHTDKKSDVPQQVLLPENFT